jgi:hypothetical protein
MNRKEKTKDPDGLTPIRELTPPTMEQLIEWTIYDSMCEAACPYGCIVEPDGTCEHGRPSWLIVLGLI